MSAEATFWAWSIRGLKSTQKLVLLYLANCHNSVTGQCNPSGQNISDNTGLNKKTVFPAREALVNFGLIERHGNSFKLNLGVTEIDPKMGQNINTKNGSEIHPKTGHTPKNGSTQKRVNDRPKNGSVSDPKTGHEPKRNLKENLKDKKNNTKKDFDFSSWPCRPSEQVWIDYETLRKQKRAPVTQTVINSLGKTLTELAGHGYRVDDVLAHCCERGWQGLKTEWILNTNRGAQRNDYPRKPTLIDRVAANCNVEFDPPEVERPGYGETLDGTYSVVREPVYKSIR